MSLRLRAILIICSVGAFILCIKKIRESKLKIENSITWLLGCIVLVIISIFYNIPQWISEKIGIISPANFIFMTIIAFLLIQSFIDSLRLTELNEKIKNLNHYIALKEKYDEDRKK